MRGRIDHAAEARKRIVRAYRTSWCFHCRKVTDHLYQIVSTVEPSYYEPVPQIVCARCGILDADLFPGTSREWEW